MPVEIKISALDPAPVTPTGTEVLAVVQGSTTHKTTIDSLKPALVDNLSTGAPTWDVNGKLTAGYDIIAGGNHTGRVALTINDGYGNANLTFNHTNGIPDVNGSSARIAVSVDSNQEVMDFQLKGSVTAGSALSLTPVLRLYDDGIQLLKATTCLTPTQNAHVARKDYVDGLLATKATTASVTAVSQSLTNHIGATTSHTKAQVGLSNVNNTSDANKPISTATQTALNGKIGEGEINTAHFTFANNTLSLKTILEGQIGTGAVTESKIGTGAVTVNKIGTGAVTPGKLSTGAPNWNEHGILTIGGGLFTGGELIEVNYWGSGDRNAYIDFHSQGAVGDNGYDYDARLFRYPGVDGKFELSNKGTGPITVDREIADITDAKSIVTKEYVDNIGYPAYRASVPISQHISRSFTFTDPPTRALYPAGVTIPAQTVNYTVSNGTWTGSGSSNDLFVRLSIQFYNSAGTALSIKYEDATTRAINTSNGTYQTAGGAIALPAFTLTNSDWDNIFIRIRATKMGGRNEAFGSATLFFESLNNTLS
jgi:hypothetical protein